MSIILCHNYLQGKTAQKKALSVAGNYDTHPPSPPSFLSLLRQQPASTLLFIIYLLIHQYSSAKFMR